MFCTFVFSDEQALKPLTLDDCISLARKSNESVKIQTQIINQADQEIFQAKGSIQPNLSYLFEKNYEDTNNGSSGSNGAESVFSVTQPLFHGLADLKTIELIKTNKHIAELQLQDVTRNLDSQVERILFACTVRIRF